MRINLNQPLANPLGNFQIENMYNTMQWRTSCALTKKPLKKFRKFLLELTPVRRTTTGLIPPEMLTLDTVQIPLYYSHSVITGTIKLISVSAKVTDKFVSWYHGLESMKKTNLLFSGCCYYCQGLIMFLFIFFSFFSRNIFWLMTGNETSSF